MLVAHPVPAAPFDFSPVPLWGLEIVLVIRLDAVELAQGLGLHLDRPGRQPPVTLRLQPLVDVLLCFFQRSTFRVVFPDVLDKVFRMLPVGLIGVEGENLILIRPSGHCFLFALAKRLHRCQAVIGLLVKIFRVRLILSSHWVRLLHSLILSEYIA